VWLAPGAFSRVQVTRIHATGAGGRRFRVFLRRGLASLMAAPAGEAIDGGWLYRSPAHIAAEAAYQRALGYLRDKEKEFQAGRASDEDLSSARAEAGAAEAGRDWAADADRRAYHVQARPGETALVFATVPGEPGPVPVLDGQPATPADFARAITVLAARHPELDQRVFRLAGVVSREYAQELADITGRSIAAASVPAGAMPPTGRWRRFLPRARPRELSLTTPDPASDHGDDNGPRTPSRARRRPAKLRRKGRPATDDR
jgi:hypothetical protein